MVDIDQTKTITGASASESKVASLDTASQWQLMWLKFRKHRLAMLAAVLVCALYLMAALCEFIAPYAAVTRNVRYAYAPPQRLHWISQHGVSLRPFVYRLDGWRDQDTMRPRYRENTTQREPLRLFVHGERYRCWGIFETDRHLFGVRSGNTIFLLGTDRLGRDIFSRIVYGARVSLTIGLLGVLMSFVLGLLIGCISGYAGGWVDMLIQRVIEILRSFPAIPLWLALSAALPSYWSPLQIYLGITVLLSFIGWTGLARQVRGKILSLRQEDFAVAALLAGASQWRIMTRHLLPSFMSHIIVTITLAIPSMILGETALSFLGLGLRPPVTSWGVLLKEAQNVQSIVLYPWLLTPVIFVILTVLAFNFVGDGLRDAADPYA